MDNNSLTTLIAAYGLFNLIIGLLGFVMVSFIPTYCFWRLYEKAGYNPRWGLFALIPGAQIILLIVLALLDWEKRKETTHRRSDGSQ